jgi:hypothetical protein
VVVVPTGFEPVFEALKGTDDDNLHRFTASYKSLSDIGQQQVPSFHPFCFSASASVPFCPVPPSPSSTAFPAEGY